MAPRVFWKGYLKLSLVTCQVTMEPAATDSAKVKFRTLNASTGNPVTSRFLDEGTGKPVDEEDEVKGYPKGENDYVLLEAEEIDSVALESTRTIDIDMFVPEGSIAPIWYDRPHYLVPSDKIGEEAFSVIRSAMAATKTVGIARLVLYRRERAVLLRPMDKGILVWTLRYGDEVRDPDDYFSGIGSAKPEKALVEMIEKVIDSRKVAWSADMTDDPVQARLLEIIAAKKKGRKRPAKPEAPKSGGGSNVVSIMDALKKSLAAEGRKSR